MFSETIGSLQLVQFLESLMERTLVSVSCSLSSARVTRSLPVSGTEKGSKRQFMSTRLKEQRSVHVWDLCKLCIGLVLV